jgi:hypothetical protein
LQIAALQWDDFMRMLVGLVPAVALLFGCGGGGPPKYVVKGRLTFHGEPMPVKPMVGRLRLFFAQQDVPPPVDPKPAAVKPDGTFEVRGGGDGTGIVAGKYKICVTWQDDYPTGEDKLNQQFDQNNSKIYRKVPDDGDINIDVSRLEG